MALDSAFTTIGDRWNFKRKSFKDAIQQARADKRKTIAGGLPVVQISDRQLNEATGEVLAILEKANDPPTMFRRGNVLATIQQDELGQAVVARYDPFLLRSRLARVAAFAVFHKNGGAMQCAPPMDIVNDVLSCGEGNFPALKGLTNVPPLHMDGTIQTGPGYDATTRLYFHPEPGFSLGSMTDAPVKQDAARAADFIREEILRDFPFAAEADQTNAMGALLSGVLRQSLDFMSPLFAFDAPSPGSGKTLLASAVVAAATGELPAMYSLPETDAEVRKGITTMLDGGARVIIYDNVSRTLRSPALSSVLTAEFWIDRLLGSNKTIKVPQQAVWFVTGNNMSFSREIARRVCRIKIDPQMAHPETRTQFKRKDEELIAWVRAQRGAVVAALLTMAQSWIVAGRPKAQVPSIGSFDRWAQTIGGILEFAGLHGFLGNLHEVRIEADEESSEWEVFLTAWARKFGAQEVTAAMLSDCFHLGEEGRAWLPEELQFGELITLSKRMGKALARKAGTRFGDRELRVERCAPDSHTKVALWRVGGNLEGLFCGVSCGISTVPQDATKSF